MCTSYDLRRKSNYIYKQLANIYHTEVSQQRVQVIERWTESKRDEMERKSRDVLGSGIRASLKNYILQVDSTRCPLSDSFLYSAETNDASFFSLQWNPSQQTHSEVEILKEKWFLKVSYYLSSNTPGVLFISITWRLVFTNLLNFFIQML